MNREWYLDIVRHDGRNLLAVIDTQARTVEFEALDGADATDVVRALRNVMMRTVPGWPRAIITDQHRLLTGLGEKIGVEQRLSCPSIQRIVERRIREALA
ncbi:MAG: hypothetical protein CVT77_06425 [Alphaproteobacteria bacterium HGW-Alphaproteobacteria-16]|nr:MAG: hypothetical protein CVT77_06425 [Alphaproteobacteria bacterium HGW-Alphaproteobacteria-16]